MQFIHTSYCDSNEYCYICRKDARWRGFVNGPDECPFNFRIDILPKTQQDVQGSWIPVCDMCSNMDCDTYRLMKIAPCKCKIEKPRCMLKKF